MRYLQRCIGIKINQRINLILYSLIPNLTGHAFFLAIWSRKARSGADTDLTISVEAAAVTSGVAISCRMHCVPQIGF